MSHVYGNVKARMEIWWDPLPRTNPCLLWQVAEARGSPVCPQQPCSPPALITQALATEQLLKEGGMEGRRNETPSRQGKMEREGHEHEMSKCQSAFWFIIALECSDQRVALMHPAVVVQAVNAEQ